MLSAITRLVSSLAELVGFLSGAIAIVTAVIALYRYFLPAFPGRIINRLFDALKQGMAISTKAEVIYQMLRSSKVHP